jgi:nucleoside 2-deoxyribosyltransferase
MKIYFAGSIRAGRDDAALYAGIIAHLKEYAEVLTEHIGDAGLTDGGQSELSDTYIHDRDLAWLLSADAVAAEVTTPSLGVGYEIGTAVSRGIPVIALYRPQPGKALSAMISGCGGVRVIEYDGEPENVFSRLDDAVAALTHGKRA